MIKEQIEAKLLQKGTFNNKLSDYGLHIWRQFIYGDWSERDYVESLNIAKETNKRKLRTFVVYNYCNLVCKEFHCSYSYAQKCIVDIFGKQSLESINDLLIKELKELNNE
tara:strand:- start:199 stop:528 length:330 start_codon:yes stop_codon:yes gene_type:complete